MSENQFRVPSLVVENNVAVKKQMKMVSYYWPGDRLSLVSTWFEDGLSSLSSWFRNEGSVPGVLIFWRRNFETGVCWMFELFAFAGVRFFYWMIAPSPGSALVGTAQLGLASRLGTSLPLLSMHSIIQWHLFNKLSWNSWIAAFKQKDGTSPSFRPGKSTNQRRIHAAALISSSTFLPAPVSCEFFSVVICVFFRSSISSHQY